MATKGSLSVAMTDAMDHEPDLAFNVAQKRMRVEPLAGFDLQQSDDLQDRDMLPVKTSPQRSVLKSPTKKLVMASPPASPKSGGDKKLDIRLRTAVLQQVLELLDREDSVVETTREILRTLGNLQLDHQEVRLQALEVLQNLQGKYAAQQESHTRNSGRAKQHGGLRHCKAFLLACANEIVELEEENPRFDYAETCSEAEFPTKMGSSRNKNNHDGEDAGSSNHHSKERQSAPKVNHATNNTPAKDRPNSATKKRSEIRHAANSPVKVPTAHALTGNHSAKVSNSPPKCGVRTKDIYDYCSSVDTCSINTAPSDQALADQGSLYQEVVDRAEELDANADLFGMQQFQDAQRRQAAEQLRGFYERLLMQRCLDQWRRNVSGQDRPHRRGHKSSNKSSSSLSFKASDLALKFRTFEALRENSKLSPRNQMRKQLAFSKMRQSVLDAQAANDNLAEVVHALNAKVHRTVSTSSTTSSSYFKKPETTPHSPGVVQVRAPNLSVGRFLRTAVRSLLEENMHLILFLLMAYLMQYAI